MEPRTSGRSGGTAQRLRRRHVAAVAVAAMLAASGPVPGADEAPAPRAAAACDTYASPPARAGAVPAALPELSGLAASRHHDGVFWAHNDSGNALELFAIDAEGDVRARFPVDGARALDAEDIATGPCAAGDATPCIYVADIGDNGARRKTVQILKVPEPAELRSRRLRATALPFRYPEGPRNAEALVVDPRDATLVVITKTIGSLGDVYRLDLAPGRTGTARRIGRLRAATEFDSYTTAADVHPSGERLLLRTYGRAWELRGPGTTSVVALLEVAPVQVPSAPQAQAEAIAYAHEGRGYLLGTEGAGQPLYRVECQAP